MFGEPAAPAAFPPAAGLPSHSLGAPFSAAASVGLPAPLVSPEPPLLSAAAAAAAPASAAEQYRTRVAEMALRVERAQREVADAKNAILKRKAQTALQAVQAQQQELLAQAPPP